MKRKISVFITILLLINILSVNVYSKEEETLIFEENFNKITSDDLGKSGWYNNNQYSTKTVSFRSWGASLATSLGPDKSNCIYLATDVSQTERRLDLSLGNTYSEGKIVLTYDFYPANGTNAIWLWDFPKDWDVHKNQVVAYSSQTLPREWLKVTFTIDLDEDKAIILIKNSKEETVLSTSNNYKNTNLGQICFVQSGTDICTASKSAMLDNVKITKIITDPVKYDAWGSEGRIVKDFEQPIFSSDFELLTGTLLGE